MKCFKDVDERVSVAGRVQISTLRSWALDPFAVGGGLEVLVRWILLVLLLAASMALVKFVTLSIASKEGKYIYVIVQGKVLSVKVF